MREHSRCLAVCLVLGWSPTLQLVPPSPLLGTRVQPQRKINKRGNLSDRQARSPDPRKRHSAGSPAARALQMVQKKKRKREKFASSGVLPKPSPFPPQGEKTQDSEGSKENLGFRVFPRKKKKIGWTDGRTGLRLRRRDAAASSLSTSCTRERRSKDW